MLSDVVAQQVVDRRRRAGMTQAQLADRCKALGWPGLTTGAVGSIETGRPASRGGPRVREVTADELAGLALALDVPPVALLAPFDAEQVEITPGYSVDPWSAILWLIGRQPLEDHPATPGWTAAAESIRQASQVADLVEAFRGQRARSEIVAGVLPGDRHDAEHLDESERRILRGLAAPLGRLRQSGHRLPVLPGDVRTRAVELGVDLPAPDEVPAP